MEKHPTICNLCGGKVIFTSNSNIYGREYGSGKCYMCTSCRAFVGTHVNRPDEAYGILSNAEMRELRKECHDLFDEKWQKVPEKKQKYARTGHYEILASKMGIPVEECHFGNFTLEQLKEARELLMLPRKQWKREVD